MNSVTELMKKSKNFLNEKTASSWSWRQVKAEVSYSLTNHSDYQHHQWYNQNVSWWKFFMTKNKITIIKGNGIGFNSTQTETTNMILILFFLSDFTLAMNIQLLKT